MVQQCRVSVYACCDMLMSLLKLCAQGRCLQECLRISLLPIATRSVRFWI